MTLQMKQDTGGTVTLQAATSGTATATVPAIAGVVSVELKGADIASATTTDLSAATGDFVDVTGTTTITGLGTLAAGIERTVRFTGALTLTHHATSLILPGAANITTAANDRAIFRSLGSGNWICISYNKASGAAVVSGGGGLTNFTESTATYSSQVYVALVPNNAASNVNAIFGRKGNGYISAQIPTGSSTGGDQRGTYAIDWQVNRALANEVASGYRSVVSGGYRNKASGTDSVSIGGRKNSATSVHSTAIGGYANVSSGNGSIAGGRYASATSTGSVALGGYLTASASYSIATGRFSLADKYGQNSHASGRFSATGDAQRSEFCLRGSTANATPAEIFLDGSSERMTIPTDTTWGFDILVVARRTDANNESATYHISGCIDNNAGTTALVGSPTYLVTIEDTAAWDCVVSADNTNDALIITVTGEAAKTIRWFADVRIAMVTG